MPVHILVTLFRMEDDKTPDNKTRYFAAILPSPRPAFPMDITDEEKQIMKEHSEFWHKLLKNGQGETEYRRHRVSILGCSAAHAIAGSPVQRGLYACGREYSHFGDSL